MDMQTPPTYEPPLYAPPPVKDNKNLAIAALVLGIVNLCTCSWLVPLFGFLCGYPVGIASIVCGIMGLKSSNKTLAIIGIVVGVLAMLLTLINAVAGAVLGATNPGLYDNIINSL